MFKKYNDTPAAIAMGLLTLFYLFQVIAFFLTKEDFFADAGLDPAALPMANWLVFLFATIWVGLVLTFVKGPDGQGIFFIVLLIVQIGGPIGSWIEIATDAATASPPSQVVIQLVGTVVFLFAYFRLRSRL
jgi:hypothetical protein